MNSLQNFYIYSETIRNNQINEGSNKIYNVLTPHENDRRRLSARALPLTPQMVAGKHHFGPNSDPQFPDRNSKRKIKKLPCLVIKAYCLLRNDPQFPHVEVFNSDGKLVNVSAVPVTV